MPYRFCTQPSVLLFGGVHGTIEFIQKLVLQQIIVHQVPLAPRVMIRIIITLPWEVQPFRMAKFVAHEVQIGLAAQRMRNQADHFVQGNATIDDQ